ncbi:hypothetical protein J1614_011117 [Plenodomus biglobosus]|nr:hypothetical protein J1614_011117 [Plenodomus biglobosus]
MIKIHEPGSCAMCSKSGKLKCSGCNSMHYCSNACQKTDWRLHKLVCKTFKIHMITQPSPEHRSVIYFPVEEVVPRFMWMKWTEGHNHPGHDALAPLGFNAGQRNGHGAREFKYNEILNRHIEPQHLGMLLPEIDRLSPYNLPLNQNLASIDSEMGSWLHGPVLVWGLRCEGDVCNTASLNMGPMDFRHAIDEIRTGYDLTARNDEVFAKTLCPLHQVVAVRLNCVGDTIVGSRPSYESVVEDIAMLKSESELSTPIADYVGIPLIVRKVAPGVLWRDRHLRKRKRNHYVDILDPLQQALHTGSVIVARKDGKPLLPTHMLALACFTVHSLKDPKLPKNACITPDMLQMDRLDLLPKDGFKRWFVGQWRKSPLCDKSAPSPFTITREYDDKIQDVDVKNDCDGSNWPCCG